MCLSCTDYQEWWSECLLMIFTLFCSRLMGLYPMKKKYVGNMPCTNLHFALTNIVQASNQVIWNGSLQIPDISELWAFSDEIQYIVNQSSYIELYDCWIFYYFQRYTYVIMSGVIFTTTDISVTNLSNLELSKPSTC